MGPLSFNGSMLVVSDCFFFFFSFPPFFLSLSLEKEGGREKEGGGEEFELVDRTIHTHTHTTRKRGKGRDGERPVRTAIVGWR